MGFRDRMKKKKGNKGLSKRHNEGTKSTGGGRFPTIFNKDIVPEGREFWRCKEGEHLADVIPFEAGPDMPFGEDDNPITGEGDLDYVLDLFVHMNVGAMNKPFVCPYENFGKDCPICEFIKANRLDKEDWKKLVAKHRVVYLLWVHDSRDDEKKGIQIFEASHFFMQEKIEEISKLPRGGGYENFSDPDKGKTLAWTRKGSGQENTQYLGHRFISRDSPIPDRILDQSFPLDSIVNMHPEYSEIEKEFRGTLKKLNLLENDDDDEGDDTPFKNDHYMGDDVPEFNKEDDEEEKKSSSRKRTTSRKTSSGKSTTKKSSTGNPVRKRKRRK